MDDFESVVEVVGNARGKAAQGLEFLALVKLILGQFSLGDVLSDADRAGDVSVRTVEDGVVPRDQPPGALSGDDLVFVVRGGRARGDNPAMKTFHFLTNFGGGEKDLEPVAAQHLLAAPACELEQKIVAEADRPLGVEADRDEVDVLKGLPVAALGLARFVIGRLALDRGHGQRRETFGDFFVLEGELLGALFVGEVGVSVNFFTRLERDAQE